MQSLISFAPSLEFIRVPTSRTVSRYRECGRPTHGALLEGSVVAAYLTKLDAPSSSLSKFVNLWCSLCTRCNVSCALVRLEFKAPFSDLSLLTSAFVCCASISSCRAAQAHPRRVTSGSEIAKACAIRLRLRSMALEADRWDGLVLGDVPVRRYCSASPIFLRSSLLRWSSDLATRPAWCREAT